MNSNSLSSLSKGCVKLTQLSSTVLFLPISSRYSGTASSRTNLLAALWRALGRSSAFFQDPKEQFRKTFRVSSPPCQPLCDTWESLQPPSVSFAFSTKGFCPNRAGFVSVLAELSPCMNNARVKQTRSFSHLMCTNKLKFHWHTAGKPTDHTTDQPEDKICL